MFTTYHGMIIHLESGVCQSQIDRIDLNRSAAMCYQWKAYLDEEWRDELLQRHDLEQEYVNKIYAFHCPECRTVFSTLSGLFQHVHSKVCLQTLYSGKMAKLVRWLEKQHDVSMQS
ncbi:uncharacterized protein PV09_04111 [Verruconis gallopava]|uniref:C2H2-type domain-containing protein n=1 Tax=Verruconis gallopava TaxID=253628 RepID=A0A0D1XQM9_9PEZI|nr:uncharacterized protein PV09_04111 [Verruconis gallopava]KIW04946.1 hypothetical protein PV09_04111 [Verruconis gallopava]